MKYVKNLCAVGVFSLLFFAGLTVQAQQQLTYLLNQEAVNQRTGVELAKYQQQERVLLGLDKHEGLVDYDSLVVYLARGNRPLVRKVMDLSQHQQMDISQVLKIANAGDRLVVELLRKEEETDESIAVIFLY